MQLQHKYTASEVRYSFGLPSEKTSTLSLRIPSELKTLLRTAAKSLGRTMNAVVTMELYRVVEWERVGQGFDSITVSKKILAALIESASEDSLKDIGRSLYATRLKDQASAIFGKPDLEALMKLVQLKTKYLFAPAALYSEFKNEDSVNFLVRHGVSKQWSILLGEAFVSYLNDANEEATYDARENSVEVKIKQDPHK